MPVCRVRVRFRCRGWPNCCPSRGSSLRVLTFPLDHGWSLPPRGDCERHYRGGSYRGIPPRRSETGRSRTMRLVVHVLAAFGLLLAVGDPSFAVRGDSPGHADMVANTPVQIAQVPIPTITIPTLPIPIGTTTTTVATTTTTVPGSTTTTTTVPGA